MAGANGSSCAIPGCDSKVMSDELCADIFPCECHFKICRDCYINAVKTGGGICPGCKEPYQNTELDEVAIDNGHPLLLPPPSGMSKMERRLSMMKSTKSALVRSQTGDFDHNRWLFEQREPMAMAMLYGQRKDERTGSSQRSVGTYDSSSFNDWISDMEIQEIKSFGSRFTWCRPNGSVRSRLDRCLVLEHWLLKWPDSSHQVLHRDYSDHYPIILKTKLVDWGPKPFRVMDCWPKNKEYQRLVKEVWCGDQQLGWGSIVLKNKLRNLKSSLKQWSIENGDVNNNKIQQLIYLSSIFIYS
ncbi:Cellulose synthase-like protein D2 [Glycine soja]|uniref:Cellulose synthase-like protein D2 n=1 Tax=Glycine soja TaxID=3848 RepID=A0A445JY22_GLYSO|nr:Cellulose synthase-like protein D2 [Glycine soja]